MPMLDGTGPQGMGPMTGRGAGIVGSPMGAPPMEMPMPPTTDAVIGELGGMQISIEETKDNETAYEENVQYDISADEKAKIAQYIIQLVDQVKLDRADWESIRKESLDLLEGIRPPKSDPWTNCSNIDTMATATHCKLIHSKIFPAVWNENLIHWRPQEKSDVADVEKIQKFMGWVVRQELKLQNTIDDIIWDIVVNGTVALKTRWVTEYRTIGKRVGNHVEYEEVAHQKCVIDNIPIDEIYLPTLWKGVDDSEFIAQDIYMRLPEIEDLASRKIFQVDDIANKLTPKLDEQVPDTLRSKKKEIEGVAESKIEAFKSSMPVRLIECYMKWMINGKLKESIFTVAYESGAYLSGKPLSAVSPIGKRPWVIGQLMRRTGRPYGIGFPELMRGLVKELNAIHNQRIDAGSISIAPFGFYRAASSFKPQNVEIGPGVMIPVDDINDVKITTLQHNPVASFQEERIIIEFIEKLTSVSAYQMGRESDIVKSRATATGTMSLMNQGEQAFTILGVRCQSIISRLLTQVLQQYQMWMPIGFADRILGESAGKMLSPDGAPMIDIAGQYDAYMTLDTTAGNKQMERQGNAAMVQMGPTLMALAQDPRGWEMASDFVKSLNKVEVEKYIGPKPQQGVSGGIPMGPGMGNVMTDGGGGQGGQPPI